MRLSEKRSLEIVALNLLRVSSNLNGLYEIPAPDSEDHRAVPIMCSALKASMISLSRSSKQTEQEVGGAKTHDYD